jgi:succinyl-diaminopimelate desuccinylase
MLRWDSDSIELTLDCRCPFCLSKDDLLTKLDSALGAIGFERTYCKYSDGHFLDPDGFLCKTLMNIYSEYSGKQSQSISIGGGTYAKGIHNTIAFGCAFPNRDYHIHDANEFVDIDELLLQAEIYAQAIINLLNA